MRGFRGRGAKKSKKEVRVCMGFDFVRQVRVRLGLRLDVGDDLTDGSHLSSRKEKKKQKGRKREEDRRCGLAGEVMYPAH
jgi:hypothetical protein